METHGPHRPSAPEPAAGGTPSRRSLDGTWRFLAGPAPAGVDPTSAGGPDDIAVPGLWEAQGWLGLDGEAWYYRELDVPEAEGHWTLQFGAVMDEAEVFVNGRRAGGHLGGYTPFEVPVSGLLRPGRNSVAVRVVDHPLDGWDHVRSAHGKQGWMNHVFPSPPSLYMTYGGIWQPVALYRHGGVRVRDVFVDGDPDALTGSAAVTNERDEPATVDVSWSIGGHDGRRTVALAAGETRTVTVRLDGHGLARWSPAAPVLHTARFDVRVGDRLSDTAAARFGVRRVRLDGHRLVVDDVPVRVMAALVQGFRADTLYAEGRRDAIEAEVSAAKAAGFTMLRLHIKAFDPTYLDVCDELGMLVHCDLPVAEPIAHDELGATGVVADRAAAAASEQVRRDRNHPSVVLWSAMNELCAENLPARRSPGYEAFARRLYRAVLDADGTRPVIENDWVEPDPETVFCSPILTAHWYGRLSGRYLESLWAKTRRVATGRRPFLLSEFGDWGLPDLTDPAQRPFWWPAHLTSAVAGLPWPGDVDEFTRGTQVYQGLADRLQIELCRALDGVSGWCLTELTDVPHEYNGLWQLDRTPKRPALAAVAGAMRPTVAIALPTHDDASGGYRGSWSGWAGSSFPIRLVVAHDEPGAPPVVVDVLVDDRKVAERGGRLAPHAPADLGVVQVPLPGEPGVHTLALRVAGAGGHPVVSSYDVHVLGAPGGGHRVRLRGTAADAAALARAGAGVLDEGPLVVGDELLVVGEGALDAAAAEVVGGRLAAGGTVVVLAQPVAAASHLPFPARAVDVATEWGSTPFLYTTGSAALRAAPAGAVLTTELLAVVPDVVLRDVPAEAGLTTLVGLYKPYPAELAATVVGTAEVGTGRLWVCQLPLVEAAADGDPTAVSVLDDLLAAAAGRRPALVDRASDAAAR